MSNQKKKNCKPILISFKFHLTINRPPCKHFTIKFIAHPKINTLKKILHKKRQIKLTISSFVSKYQRNGFALHISRYQACCSNSMTPTRAQDLHRTKVPPFVVPPRCYLDGFRQELHSVRQDMSLRFRFPRSGTNQVTVWLKGSC